MNAYTAKKGTFYHMKVRKRALPGDTQERIDDFKARLEAIDKKSLPKASLLDKSPDKFEVKYKSYLAEVKAECTKALAWIGADKKRSISSARPLITEFRKAVESIQYKSAYFYYLLNQLKESNPRHASKLDAIANKPFSELAETMQHIRKDLSEVFPYSLRMKILKLPYQHPALNYLKLSRTSHLKFTKESKEKSNKKHKKPVEFKVRQIIATSARILEHRKSCDWFTLVAAIIAATGRRPIEVIKTGSFTKSTLENHIKFYGQAKIRNREDSPRDIPIIGTAPEVVIDAIKIIRSEWDFSESSNDYVNNMVAKRLNLAVRREFVNEHLDCKTLRSIYGIVAESDFYDRFGKDYSKPAYIAHVLGHSANDVKTQLEYSWIRPIWTEEQALDPHKDKNEAVAKALNELADIIEASRPAIVQLQRRGTAYEDLADWLMKELRAGRFVTKTGMERDPETGESRRSRKTVDAFLKALRLPKGWPSKIEERLNA